MKSFYSNWDDILFYNYLEHFQLSKKKKFKELSRGMKLKFSLALALAHKAELLIFDEPTSGLDPVFRMGINELNAVYSFSDNFIVIILSSIVVMFYFPIFFETSNHQLSMLGGFFAMALFIVAGMLLKVDRFFDFNDPLTPVYCLGITLIFYLISMYFSIKIYQLRDL